MNKEIFHKVLTQRNLSTICFCLFSAWNLSFLFEGQVLHSLAEYFEIDGTTLLATAVMVVFLGLLTSGLFIKKQPAAKTAMIAAMIVCIVGSLIFYLPYSKLWYIALIPMAYSSGLFIACWGFYFKMYSKSEERFKTAADVLIYSNILMIVVNALTVSTSALIGLAITIFALLGTLLILFQLEGHPDEKIIDNRNIVKLPSGISVISKPFLLLCFFILVITINSGLMYEVVNPAFAHYELLTTYYWAMPYILALLILRNLPSRINKAYILYIAIALIGLSYISFMWLDRSVTSYLLINTLMLGAFGVCDLFWWSILGSYLDYHENSAQVLGLGLSMNVLGVLTGSVIGSRIIAAESPYLTTSMIALVVIFAVLILLPILNSQLTRHLKNHDFLIRFAGMEGGKPDKDLLSFKSNNHLTNKETEVVKLLLRGYTYKIIAENLLISENTLKYHVKNIYQKLNINNKMELIKMFTDNQKLQQ